jgi:hypothetical protein
VSQALENRVSILASIAVPTKSRQSSRMRCVIGACETPFPGQTFQAGISETGLRHFQQALDLKLIGGF